MRISHLHVVVGAAGGTGTALVHELRRRGHRVRAVNRTGSGPTDVEAMAADATDLAATRMACQGASTVYNAVNPPFDRWTAQFPAVVSGTIDGAAMAGARLVFVDDPWMYDRVDSPTGRIAAGRRAVPGRSRRRRRLPGRQTRACLARPPPCSDDRTGVRPHTQAAGWHARSGTRAGFGGGPGVWGWSGRWLGRAPTWSTSSRCRSSSTGRPARVGSTDFHPLRMTAGSRGHSPGTETRCPPPTLHSHEAMFQPL